LPPAAAPAGGRRGAFGRRFRRGRFARHGRRGDRGHGGVLVAAHHAGALGNVERRHVDRVTDLEAGQVDFEDFRNRIGPGAQRDLVHDHVEHAAALDAGRGQLVAEAHGDLHGDDRVGPDAQEVEMQRLVRHRIDLHVARQDVEVRAIDGDLHAVIEVAFLVNLAFDRLRFDGDHHGRLLVAVDHGGNQSFATAGTGAPFAGPVPHLRDDFGRLCHFNSPWVALSSRRGLQGCPSPDLLNF